MAHRVQVAARPAARREGPRRSAARRRCDGVSSALANLVAEEPAHCGAAGLTAQREESRRQRR